MTTADHDLGAGMLAALPHPWCRTCQHEHVAYMPAHTWRCDQCAFGSHHSDTAARHSRLHPQHDVYSVFHEMVILPALVVADLKRANGELANPPAEEA